ncbi:Spo11/DNA topoisomerase VI subunit A [Clohesyomyces aquaticus]|uniref:DNA topoisomerase (ATP-hydrolyzing) n=1 Tax=Clohesyomyces aquaticus TaxID=1231657 RepID=A0A1Y2A9B7_9PLEO|nr:Spo11/DNA topoisomerase VI subunit A [Clohesyomyces aquaticus]
MNSDAFEEMLFGFPSSQDSVDDAWEDASEEDMLEATFASEPPPWILRSSPDQLPALLDDDPDAMILEDFGESALDESLLENHPIEGPPIRKDRNWVLARIEGMLEEIVDGLLENRGQLAITLKSRSATAGQVMDSSGGRRPASTLKNKEVNFPGRTAQEAWRFTVLLRIIELVHGALANDVVLSKRDIYYRHPDLFVKQSVVDRYVDDLACTFGVTRSLLNVTAAAKSLVAGNFTIRGADGTSVHGINSKEGILLPSLLDSDVVDLSAIYWILIIEKEASFRSIVGSPEWSSLGSRCLVLTAKGYPDLSARQFLRQLTDQYPSLPMSVLVDFDPDGLAIMSTYKYGSIRLAHENVTSNDTPTLSLPLPRLSWLGVRSHQVGRTPATESGTKGGAISDAQGLMRLTLRDRKKACRMLEWDTCQEGGPEPVWRRELQTMLMLNLKAEMQILEEQPGGLASWVNDELRATQGQEGCTNGPVPQAGSAG